jgi:hypothetical protein
MWNLCPARLCAEGELVVDPATSSTIDTIHVLEDHIGVRRILFSSTEHSQKLESFLSTPVRDAWWRNIPFSTTVFYANFDVAYCATFCRQRLKCLSGR